MSHLTLSTISQQFGEPTTLTELTYKNRGVTELSNLLPCTQLRRLDLSQNSLSTIASITQCTSLQWLSLNTNKIGSIQGIQNLTSLKVLNVGYNSIADIHVVCQLQHLVALIANNNHIATLPTKLPTTLTTLILSHNEITDWSAVGRLTLLTKLSLSYNKLPGIPQELQNCTQLAELRLNHNNISVLPSTLAQNTRLKIIDLSYNSLSTFSSISILRSLPYLRNLGLSNNPLCSALEYEKEIQLLVPLITILDSHKIDRAGGSVKTEPHSDSIGDTSKPAKQRATSSKAVNTERSVKAEGRQQNAATDTQNSKSTSQRESTKLKTNQKPKKRAKADSKPATDAAPSTASTSDAMDIDGADASSTSAQLIASQQSPAAAKPKRDRPAKVKKDKHSTEAKPAARKELPAVVFATAEQLTQHESKSNDTSDPAKSNVTVPKSVSGVVKVTVNKQRPTASTAFSVDALQDAEADRGVGTGSQADSAWD